MLKIEVDNNSSSLLLRANTIIPSSCVDIRWCFAVGVACVLARFTATETIFVTFA